MFPVLWANKVALNCIASGWRQICQVRYLKKHEQYPPTAYLKKHFFVIWSKKGNLILVSLAQWVVSHSLRSTKTLPITLPSEVTDICGITQTVGAEVSKLSHAWILRYKTCLYAPVEDFMVAGGMWRKMIASRYQREREIERGGGHPKRVGSGKRETWVFVDLLGFYAYLEIGRERLDFHTEEENLF